MTKGQWLTEKPQINQECCIITATAINNEWNYKFWQIVGISDTDGVYLALCDENGDEWGDLDELTAGMYFILPDIK